MAPKLLFLGPWEHQVDVICENLCLSNRQNRAHLNLISRITQHFQPHLLDVYGSQL